MRNNPVLFIVFCLSLCTLPGCSNFLETESYTQKNSQSFPTTEEDAKQMTTSVYSMLKTQIGYARSSHFFIAELTGDDRIGGGSRSNRDSQSIDRLQYSEDSQFDDFWSTCYSGIFRANTALTSMHQISSWNNISKKDQYMGENHFLRALFYLQLVQVFGEVPLITSPKAENKPKSAARDIYSQIATDLQEAIALLPAQPYMQTESGRATRWAAQALLARTFLFYTGVYKQPSLPKNDGSTISKEEVTAGLEDCIRNSGHALVNDFRNIWSYANSWTKPNYTYSSKHDLLWEGDGCKETLFAIKFGNNSRNEGNTGQLGYSNQICLNFGLRYPGSYDDAACFPFGQGWAIGTINTTLWDDWLAEEPNDLRREATILDQTKEMPKGWTTDRTKQVEETMYWGKKYIPILAKDNSGKIWKSYSCLAFGTPENYQTSHTCDLILIRMADVYLMHSELTGTVEGINTVRQRVQLLPLSGYTLEALKKERRYELATEGLRWWDLMRWGDAITVVPAKQEGIKIKVIGYDRNYTSPFISRYAKTNGFFPIPKSQVILSNGILEQSTGWLPEDKDAYFESLPY